MRLSPLFQLVSFVFGMVGLLMGLGATPVFANSGYGAGGCGLGSVIFQPSNGIAQVFVGTTNVITLTQTFGITSGTSNCGVYAGKSSRVDASIKIDDFISGNLATLKVETARGSGTALAALATLYGCDDQPATQAAFNGVTQRWRSRIFAPAEPQAINAAWTSILHDDQQLSRSCAYAT